MRNKNCPFCNIGNRVILSGEYCNATLSDPRLLPGHTLVVPHRHVLNPDVLTEIELLDIFRLIKRVRNVLMKNGATGCDIRQNYRPFIVQNKLKVDHIHIHVLPRTNEDVLYQKSMRFEKDVFEDLPESELLKFTALLKHA